MKSSYTLALLALPMFLITACSGDPTGGGDGGQAADAGTNCKNASEVSCVEHWECKSKSVCAADRSSTICNQAARGGDGNCTAETLSIPSNGDFEVPDLGCYATRPAPVGPALVRLHGCVDVFGLDLDTGGGLELSFFRQADGLSGTPLATAISGDDQAILGKSCGNKGAFDTATATIPTNTALIFKAHDPTGEFVDTFKYGIYLGADKATDLGGIQTIEEVATVIAVSTYQVFPQTAGISAGIDGADDLSDGVGRAALAGTIDACNRREMANVSVEIDGMDANRIVDDEAGVKGRLAFTDGNENPDIKRGTTNVDGVYAAINIKAGDRTVTFKHRVGGELKVFGTFTVPVFPDSVTLFSPLGALP